jgi:hypothetical protein
MYILLLIVIVLLFAMVKVREHFSFGLIVGGKDWFSFNTEREDGTEIFSMYPNTCPGHKPEYDAGLCYERCRPGYKGVGPVCWAESKNVGVGKPVGLNPCPEGWVNDGLTCREPIRCHSIRDCFTKGKCGCWGGNIVGRLNPFCPKNRRLEPWTSGYDYNTPDEKCLKDPKDKKSPRFDKTRGVCEGEGATTADHPDYKDGLCYKKCPPDKPNRIPGMPYLCYIGGPLSYGRGVGRVPGAVRFNRSFTIP